MLDPSLAPGRVETYVETVAASRPDALAIVFGDRRWSFAQVRREMDRRAAVLAGAQLREGDVAISVEPVTDELILAFLACARLGVVLCWLSPLLTAPELAALSKRANARVSLTADGLPHPSLLADQAMPIALPGAPGAEADRPTLGINAPVMIRCTSGTTGSLPKLVLVPHRQLTWRLRSGGWWETPNNVVYQPQRNHFSVVDLSFVLCSGATAVLSHATHPAQFEAEMLEHRANVVNTVPAVLRLLASLKTPPPTLGLKAIKSISATLTSHLKRTIEDRYGVPVVQHYASSEGGFTLGTTSDGTPDDSIGKPLAGVTARLVDDQGKDVAPGTVGELWLRTPGLMLGYLDEERATDHAVRGDWLLTGDLARQDERGFFILVGRRDSRINSSGVMVLPEEIEAVLLTHPGVRDAAVTSELDPLRGETLRALIVAAEAMPSVVELRRFCRERLAAYKVPRRFEFVAQVPRTALGKVRRHLLHAL